MSPAKKKRFVTVSIRHKNALDPVDSAVFLAGVAKTDIRPPIRVPMSGCSTLSTASVGVRTKFMAHGVSIKPKSGQSVALAWDYLSGSLILHHRVAELIAAKKGATIHTGATNGPMIRPRFLK